MKTVILGKLNYNNVVNYWNIDEKEVISANIEELLSKYAIV